MASRTRSRKGTASADGKKAMDLARSYRAEGYDSSRALKMAWEDIRESQGIHKSRVRSYAKRARVSHATRGSKIPKKYVAAEERLKQIGRHVPHHLNHLNTGSSHKFKSVMDKAWDEMEANGMTMSKALKSAWRKK